MMKVAILGGAGAMGGLFGVRLALAGEDVTLVDVWQDAVDVINTHGLQLIEKSGEKKTVQVRAVADTASIGKVDLVLVFVKCYHTQAAVGSALPLLNETTTVLTLQNGWGNAARISEIVGAERVLVGVTYNSATVLGPGQIQQAGVGPTVIGELDGRVSDRLSNIAGIFRSASLEVTTSQQVLTEIWSKLALNVCTLPTSALLRFYAGQLVEHQGTLDLMRVLLQETVSVANAQGIKLDESERWGSITGLLGRAKGARASMLQDVENHRQTEIEVINGAIVAAGRELGIPTPFNETMVWLVRSLEETFQES
ncbi:MAG: 2-dehydropantoate 2-reductase [Anaerolineales bacterium]|jgi:2-dehydropantoate 2-reductase